MSETAPLTPARLVERRELISDALAKAAAGKRFVNRRRRFEAGYSDRRRLMIERIFALASFVLIAVVPISGAAFYFGWIAADQYAAEARFLLRPNQAQVAASGRALGVGAPEIGRDTQVVASFLNSQALIDALEAEMGFRARFEAESWRASHLIAPPSPDALAGLAPDDPAEDVLRFWRRMSEVEIQPNSGVVLFRVRAFTPEDAQILAAQALEEAEALVNRMNARIWADAVIRAETLLAEAAVRLGVAGARLAQVRDLIGVAQPEAAGGALIGLAAKARSELAALERERAARIGDLDAGSAKMRALDRAIAAAREQQRALELEMVEGQDGAGGGSMAAALTRFAEAEVEQEIAQIGYVAAAAQLERARHASEAQSLYLDVFSRPQIPQDARYPRRALWIGAIAAISLALWAAVRALFTLVLNHMA